jgi:RimJ/RimL family protein N-acetyltransferase
MVQVIPAAPGWLAALVDGDEQLTARFGVAVAPGWAGFPEALPGALDGARRNPGDPWGAQLFLDDDGTLVGFGGFKGPPVGGTVELGYAVAPERQGRGIATEVVRQLVERARDAGVRTVVAHTLAEENASTRVLTKSQFTRVAELDDDDGPIWRWERPLEGVHDD